MKTEINKPAVYVGTYHKYASGSIYGEWLCPGDFGSYEEFFDACKELHKDEREPEFMFQDFEYLPENLYCESFFSEEAFAYCKAIEEVSDPDAFAAYFEITSKYSTDSDEMISDFEDHFIGEYASDEDACYEYAEELLDSYNVPEQIRCYFDYSAYARDCMITDFIENNGFYFWAC